MYNINHNIKFYLHDEAKIITAATTSVSHTRYQQDYEEDPTLYRHKDRCSYHIVCRWDEVLPIYPQAFVAKRNNNDVLVQIN